MALEFVGHAAALAEQAGVRLVIEIHQYTIFSSSASLVHRLVSHTDPRWVGIIYDVGNMVVEGFEDHRIGTALLGPYLHHVHLKNAVFTPVQRPAGEVMHRYVPRWSPLDDGVVDVPAVLALLEEIGSRRATSWPRRGPPRPRR
jgi:sugar phosphate isomerase/epimerase